MSMSGSGVIGFKTSPSIVEWSLGGCPLNLLHVRLQIKHNQFETVYLGISIIFTDKFS